MNSWKEMLHKVVGWLPFSIGGAVFFLGALSALWFLGIQRSDLIMVVLGATGVALSLLGLLLTWIAGIVIYRRMRNIPFESLTLISHKSSETEFVVPIPWWIPLVQSSCIVKADHFYREEFQGKEVLFAKRRGLWSEIVREIAVGDAFGICSIRFETRQEVQLKVLPIILSLENPLLIHGLQGGSELSHPMGRPEGDRIDMRNYVAGDPIRHILWKVYARSNELMVRTPERAYEPVKKMLAYLIVDEADRIAAATASAIIQSGLLGVDWSFGVDGDRNVYSDENLALDAIVQSGLSLYSTEPGKKGGEGLRSFLNVASANQSNSHTLVVFAPPIVGSWIQNVLALQQQIPIQVIVGVDRIETESKWAAFKEAVFLPETQNFSQLTSLAELEAIHSQLQSLQIPVLISMMPQSTLQPLSQLLEGRR